MTRGGGVGVWWGGTDQHPMAARGGRHTQRPRVPPEGGEPWVRLVDGWTDTNYRGVGRGGEGRDAPHCSPFVQTCRLHSIVSNS